MGCWKETRKALKVIGKRVKPFVVAAARDIVLEFEDEAYAYMTGTMKKAAAVAALKAIAKREGQELRTSLADALISNVVLMAREKAGDLDQLGTDDHTADAEADDAEDSVGLEGG